MTVETFLKKLKDLQTNIARHTVKHFGTKLSGFFLIILAINNFAREKLSCINLSICLVVAYKYQIV